MRRFIPICLLALPLYAADPLPGHSVHGEAFDAGPRQAAVFIEGCGKVNFPITSKQADAQKFFNQGVGQLHGFWYFEAERSFRQVAMLDPDCAIAYWGCAMANVNNEKRAVAFIAEATKRKDKATKREQLWIAALQTYYADLKKDKKVRQMDFIKDCEGVIHDFPDDLEAKAFLAWSIWNAKNGGVPMVSRESVDAIISQVLAKEPMHPSHHYRIHLWDDSKPARAVDSAAKCGQAAPGIAHMWHMPGHTFSKVTREDDASWQQEAATRVDHAYMIRTQILPDQIHNYAHNTEWLIRTLNQTGAAHKAVSLARGFIEIPRHPNWNPIDKGANSASYGRTRLLETLLKFEQWDELLVLDGSAYLDVTQNPTFEANRLRALGVAAFFKADAARLNQHVAALEKLVPKVEAKPAEPNKPQPPAAPVAGQTKVEPSKPSPPAPANPSSVQSATATVTAPVKPEPNKPVPTDPSNANNAQTPTTTNTVQAKPEPTNPGSLSSPSNAPSAPASVTVQTKAEPNNPTAPTTPVNKTPAPQVPVSVQAKPNAAGVPVPAPGTNTAAKSAVPPKNTPPKNTNPIVEHALNELKALAAILKPDNKPEAEKLLDLSKDTPKERMVRYWLKLGNKDKAATLAGQLPNDVPGLALRAETLLECGKQDDAKKAFESLQKIGSQLDDDLPMSTRLAELAPKLGFNKLWKKPLEFRPDSGVRPAMDTLGPLLWHPWAAQPFALKSNQERTVSLHDYAGKPVVVLFYLGGTCEHCMKQLKTFSTAAKDFKAAGIEIAAIGTEVAESLQTTERLCATDSAVPFPLLADPELKTFKAYRCFDDFEKKALHGTMLIDGSGQVRWVDISFEPFQDAQFLLKEAKRLLQFKEPNLAKS